MPECAASPLAGMGSGGLFSVRSEAFFGSSPPEYTNDGYATDRRALPLRTRKAATGPRITASHPSHTTIDAMVTLLSVHYP